MPGFRGRWFALAVAFALLCAAVAADKKQKSKPAVVELQAFKVVLGGSQIDIDGTVHNSGERTIEKLVLSFHFFDTQHQPVSTLKLEVDDETIDPGEDAGRHAAEHQPPRAVSLEVTASGRGEKELKVINPGPYQIE